jgi:hypothetical protein
VTPEIDIWPAARLMLEGYGRNPPEESATKADVFALAGDDDRATIWRRIVAAAKRFANGMSSGPVSQAIKPDKS